MSTGKKLRELAILSGKGGAGKTTVAAAFASLAKNAVLADCDVDAPDLHLILKPEIKEKRDFFGLELAVIDPQVCTSCGCCLENCRFDAITPDIQVIRESCEGCGVCQLVCPVDAVSLTERKSGELYHSNSRMGPFVHAYLLPGEEASGKLVAEVRTGARTLAVKKGKELVLIDGPPGIACPAIASITGTTLVLIITEPTLSGMSDMKRVVQLAEHFGVPVVVGINKYDLNLENSSEIEAYCLEKNIALVGRLPYDTITTKAMIQEMSVLEYIKETGEGAEFGRLLEEMWRGVVQAMEERT